MGMSYGKLWYAGLMKKFNFQKLYKKICDRIKSYMNRKVNTCLLSYSYG